MPQENSEQKELYPKEGDKVREYDYVKHQHMEDADEVIEFCSGRGPRGVIVGLRSGVLVEVEIEDEASRTWREINPSNA